MFEKSERLNKRKSHWKLTGYIRYRYISMEMDFLRRSARCTRLKKLEIMLLEKK